MTTTALSSSHSVSSEKLVRAVNGWLFLLVTLATYAAAIAVLIVSVSAPHVSGVSGLSGELFGVLLLAAAVFFDLNFFIDLEAGREEHTTQRHKKQFQHSHDIKFEPAN